MKRSVLRIVLIVIAVAYLLYRFLFSAGVSSDNENGSIAEADSSKSMLCQSDYYTEVEAKDVIANLKTQYATAEDWKKRANVIREGILKGAGLEEFPKKCPLNTIIHSKRVYDGYQVENVAFESLPGVYVTGSLYRPIDAKGPIPGILSPHGHWGKKEDYGRYREDAQNRFASMARMGAMVFAYDMVGYGQLKEFGWEHDHIGTLKLQLWNSIRGVDFLLSMDADTDRLAITGASGGATQTFLLTAVDDRIDVSVPVVQVSAHFFGGCICESGVPIHQSEHHITNNVEIAAIAAPRPMLIASCSGDWTKNTPKVEYPHIKYIFGLMGKENLVENHHVPDQGHGYQWEKRVGVYPFLAKHLNLDLTKIKNANGKITEEGIVIEEQEKMYAFNEEHPYPEHAKKTNDEIEW